MPRICRPFALVVAILFQLMLVVAASGCAAVGGWRAGTASMAGMNMPHGNRMAALASSPDRRELPGRQPSTSNSCQSMAPCAMATIVVESSEEAFAGAESPVAMTTLALLVPASVSLAPELPPPRA